MSSMVLKRVSTGPHRLSSITSSTRHPAAVGRRPLSMQPPTPSAWKSAAPPSRVGAFVSRRQWDRVFQRPKPNQTKKGDSLDDKPWPKSIRIAGYVAGATAIPYCTAWFIASNDTMRTMVFPKAPPKFEEALRYWFGTPEVDYASYVDKMAQAYPIPSQLDQELPFQTRQEQAHIQALTQQWRVPARIRLFTHGGFNLSEVLQVPGDTPATKDALLEQLMKDREQALEPQDVAYVTVEFADIKEEEQTSSGTVVDINVMYNDPPEQEQPQTSDGNTESFASQLAKKTNIYSIWHYQIPMPSSPQQSSSSSSTKPKKYEMEVSRLEHEIQLLDKQLRDPTTTRSFDDVQEDLNAKRKELRNLKWKRWFRM